LTLGGATANMAAILHQERRQGALLQSIVAIGLAAAWSVAPAAGQAVPATLPPISLQTFKDCAQCPEMVVIPAGSGVVGSAAETIDRVDQEGPVRAVSIARAFAIGRVEITRAQYAAFVAATARPTPPGCNFWDGHFGVVEEHDWQRPGYVQRANHPVVCVSYEDARAYTAWLSETTGRAYRLPSSVEWEYAARAGASTPFFWGTSSQDACRYANIADNSLKRRWPQRQEFNCDDGYEVTAPVGSFEPNAWGLYDMLGNAWEWSEDCFHEDFNGAPSDGSAWREANGGDCAFRTPRGGAWISGPQWAKLASQSKDPAAYRSFLLGFRVAASPEK
jgi:formylglycine-generating enzyme required for sulfatase activity